MSRVQIDTNFYLDEFTVSKTATRIGHDNQPDAKATLALGLLVYNILQPVREVYGAVKVLSGYRHPLVNKAAGGVDDSQHVEGEAVDFVTGALGTVFEWIRKNLDFDQLIWEFGCDNQPDWIHVSFKRTGNRREVWRAVKENKKTKYIAM